MIWENICLPFFPLSYCIFFIINVLKLTPGSFSTLFTPNCYSHEHLIALIGVCVYLHIHVYVYFYVLQACLVFFNKNLDLFLYCMN